MNGKKKLMVYIILVIFLAAGCILAAVYLSGNAKTDRTWGQETLQQKGKQEEKKAEAETGGLGKKHWRVHQFRELGNLYYLTEDEAAFREQVSAFVISKNLNAVTITALSKFKDTKEDLEGKACFYLQLDDKEKTVIEVEYDKKTGEYSFRILEEEIPNIEDYGGEKRELPEEETCTFAEPEYTHEWKEEVDLGDPVLTDPGKKFAKVEKKEKEFLEKLLEFLEQEQETRRNLTVIKAAPTTEGYEAEFSFEQARIDGKNIKVMYNRSENKYEFMLNGGTEERRDEIRE